MTAITDILAAIRRHIPPMTDVHISINDPTSPRIYVHGIHGSGKTTLATHVAMEVAGCVCVDENYDAIRAIVSTGKNVTERLIAMLAERPLPEVCIIDRGAIDAVIYEMCILEEERNLSSSQESWNQMTAKYASCFAEHGTLNHIWLLPSDVDVARERVNARGREWDDPTTSPHFDILHLCYVEAAHKLGCQELIR